MTTVASLDLDYLKLLRKTWNNPQFSAPIPYLQRMVSLVEETHGPILECGSGLSTIVLARVTDRPIIVLEHNQEWIDKLLEFWDGQKPTHVEIRHAKIIQYPHEPDEKHDYWWYELTEPLPIGIDFVICDGPPTGIKGITNNTPMRMGLMRVAHDSLKPGVKILMDDYLKPEQDKVILTWQRQWNLSIEVNHEKSDPSGWNDPNWTQPYAVVTIPHP